MMAIGEPTFILHPFYIAFRIFIGALLLTCLIMTILIYTSPARVIPEVVFATGDADYRTFLKSPTGHLVAVRFVSSKANINVSD